MGTISSLTSISKDFIRKYSGMGYGARSLSEEVLRDSDFIVEFKDVDETIAKEYRTYKIGKFNDDLHFITYVRKVLSNKNDLERVTAECIKTAHNEKFKIINGEVFYI